MKPVLISITPLDTRNNARVTLRVADAGTGEAFGTGGLEWEPAVVQRPQLSQELFDPDLTGKFQTGRMRFAVNTTMLNFARPDELYWKGANVVLHTDGLLYGPNSVPEFVGFIVDADRDPDKNRVTITAEVSTYLIDRPLLTKTFTGGGGIGGDPGKRGAYLPAGFGSVKNIEVVWFDQVRNIGMIDGYANTVSIDWCGEGLNSLGPRFANYSTYAALAAAIDAGTVPPGRWATCVAEGLVGLGAPPTGPITVHAVFGTNRAGALMRRIAQTHAGVATASIDTAAFTALDAAVPRAVHYWTVDQRGCLDLWEAIARSVNASPLVTLQGRLSVTRAVFTASKGTIDLNGNSTPRVLRSLSNSPDAPVYQMAARAARPARVLSYSEVNYVDTIEDRGLYNAATTYAAGNIVWLSNGSQWLYTNTTATKGNSPAAIVPPATSNAYWTQMQPPKTATDFTYADGRTIEELQPAEADATNSADPNSAFGPDKTVGETIDSIDKAHFIQYQDILQQAEEGARRKAADLFQGVNTGVMLKRVEEKRSTFEEQYFEVMSFLGAIDRTRNAFVFNADKVLISPGQTLASSFQLVEINTETVRASVSSLSEVVEEGDQAYALLVEKIGVFTPGGDAFVLRSDLAVAGADGLEATTLQAVRTKLGDTEASAELALRSLNGEESYAALTLTAGNKITGFKINGVAQAMDISVLDFRLTHPGTGETYFSADPDKVRMRNVEVDTIKVGTVVRDTVAQGALAKASYVVLDADAVCPISGTITVFSFQIYKEDADSLLEITIFAQCSNPDDIIFTSALSLDGTVVQRPEFKMIFDGPTAKAPVTVMAIINAVPAGDHTVSWAITNQEADGALSVKVGSVMKVNEMRRASIGNPAGSAAPIVTDAAGNSVYVPPSGGGVPQYGGNRLGQTYPAIP